uniref:hypothetical protein n=1 Tax=Streptomyces sp. CA-136453 TaxID=3240050 RepID=UPI003F492131
MTNFDDVGWGDEDVADVVADALRDGEATVKEDRESADVVRRQDHEAQIDAAVARAVEAATPGLDKIPAPYEPSGDGELTSEDERNLAACMAGVELLNTGYWIAGKSLATMATARLFRKLKHKDRPGEFYTRIEDWAWWEHSLRLSKVNKLMASWDIAEELARRGFNPPEGQVRELVPLRNKHGMNAAIGLYEFVHQATGGKLTAANLRQTVAILPGDLALKDDDGPAVIQQKLTELTADGAEQAENAAPRGTSTLPVQLKRGVDRRAIALADKMGRGRIPRADVIVKLLEAFADEQDTRVFDAVYERMKSASE